MTIQFRLPIADRVPRVADVVAPTRGVVPPPVRLTLQCVEYISLDLEHATIAPGAERRPSLRTLLDIEQRFPLPHGSPFGLSSQQIYELVWEIAPYAVVILRDWDWEQLAEGNRRAVLGSSAVSARNTITQLIRRHTEAAA
ncbi:hypothetical protein [Mycobacteroides chelonae]|uniref:hypothetical protein n=1 Tax=Mycobacteroides chelonae TaxID=1774 RepID=UPI0012FF6BA4|nr:hypothetical protein [Mycobacteroides chelonae]